MDAAQLSGLVDELNYTLAKISKYLKNNQYVYLRPFESWTETYNAVAEQLNADKIQSAPIFKLSPGDYSPSGKSIIRPSVEKFVEIVNHQVFQLEEKIDELHKAAALKLAAPHPLAGFFPRDPEGEIFEPLAMERRVVVAVPQTKSGRSLYRDGIQPVLEAQKLSWFDAAVTPLDDAGLCELCQELFSCRLAIFDLAGQASNVMLALGLAYGIGKPVILLHPENETTLGALNNSGYLSYAVSADIKASLAIHLRTFLEQNSTP